jgi:thermostable 8-oxoguanine DNA glycosylase
MAWPYTCPNPLSIHKLTIEQDDKHHKVNFRWGDARVFGTASYWISQYLIIYGQSIISNQNIGSNLFEETIACLLGGHGIPAELGLAAFNVLKSEGLTTLGTPISSFLIEQILSRPILIGKKYLRYRFAKQRSMRIMGVFKYFRENPNPPNEPYALRDWLLKINGIGMKTASWIVRNHTSFTDIAIIDIHIHNAGIAAGFFSRNWRVPKDYTLMEKAFIGFAKSGCIPASGLDALIWSQMRILRTSNIITESDRVRLFHKTDKGLPINALFP